MTVLSEGVKAILESFVQLKLISSYAFEVDDFADEASAAYSFGEALPVSFQFTLQAPINILSFIEQFKQDTFLHPDLLATTVAA